MDESPRSLTRLVHAFITSRVDYCSSLLIGAPKKMTDKLQRVLNSAARIVSNTRKFDRGLTHFRKVSYTGWTLLTRLGSEPPNTCRVSTYCQLVSSISGRRHLRSADRRHLNFPRVKLASYRGCSFAYSGPSNWNSLPVYLRDNSLSLSSFKRHLKTFLFSFY